MKKLFLKSILFHVVLGLVLGLMAVGFMVSDKAVDAKSFWNSERHIFDQWVKSGTKNKCDALWRRLEQAEVPAPGCTTFELLAKTPQNFAKNKAHCDEIQVAAQVAIKHELEAGGCVVVRPFVNLEVRYDPIDPGPYTTWAYKYIVTNQAEGMFKAALFVFLVSFGLLQVGKLFLKETHTGWRRLSVVASGVLGLATFIYMLTDDGRLGVGDVVEIFISSIAAFLASLLFFLAGRRVLGWIQKGFVAGAETQTTLVNTAPSARGSEPAIVLDSPNATEVVATPVSMAHTKELPDQNQLVEVPPEGKLSPTVQLNHAQELPRALYWTRVWARVLDVTLAVFVANVVAIFIPSATLAIDGFTGIVVDRILWMLVYCVVVVAYDSALLPAYGTSPGKALFGLVVKTPEGFLITRKAAYERSLLMLSSGLWYMIFFPVVQIAVAYSYAKKGSVPWDFTGRGVVYQRPVKSFRRVFGIALAVAMLAGMALTQQILKHETRKEISEQILGS